MARPTTQPMHADTPLLPDGGSRAVIAAVRVPHFGEDRDGPLRRLAAGAGGTPVPLGPEIPPAERLAAR